MIIVFYLGWTALHYSAMKGQTEVTKFLVESGGADVNAKNNIGEYVIKYIQLSRVLLYIHTKDHWAI